MTLSLVLNRTPEASRALHACEVTKVVVTTS